MARKVERTRAGGQWTEARFWGFLRSALRAAGAKWPPKHAAKKEARRPLKGTTNKFEYQCADCQDWFATTEVQVDHIVPVGSLKTWDDIGGFAERMFCEIEGFQIMCKPCHQEKTNNERKGKQAEADR